MYSSFGYRARLFLGCVFATLLLFLSHAASMFDSTLAQGVPPEIIVDRSPVGTTSDLTFSADGTLMASIASGLVKIWDADTLRTIRELPALCDSVTFTADSQNIVCESDNAEGAVAAVWSARTGSLVNRYTVKGQRGPGGNWILVPTGKLLLFSTGQSLRQIDLASGRTIREFPKLGRAAGSWECIAVSNDGGFAAAPDQETKGTAVWNLDTGARVGIVPGTCQVGGSMALSARGDWLALGASGRTRLYDVRSGTADQNLPGARKLRFDPAGAKLAIIFGDDLAVVDVRTGGKIGGTNFSREQSGRQTPWDGKDRSTPVGTISAAAFNSDGRIVAGFSPRRRGDISPLKVYDPHLNSVATLSAGRIASVHAITLDPAERLLAVAAGETIALWNLARGRVEHFLDGADQFQDLAFSPHGDTLTGVTTSYLTADTILRWTTANGERLEFSQQSGKLDLPPHRPHVQAVAHHPSAQIVATAGRSWREAAPHRIFLWNAATGHVSKMLDGHDSDIVALAFSPDGKYLVSGTGSNDADEGGSVGLWSLAASKRIAEMDFLSPPLAFTGQTTLVSGNGHGGLVLWDVRVRRIQGQLTGTAHPILKVAAAPEGRWIASGDAGGGLALWSAPFQGEPRRVQGHAGEITGLTFNRDGTQLWSAGTDGSVRLWRVEEDTLRLRASLYFFEDEVSVVTTPTGLFDTDRLEDIEKRIHYVLPTDPSRVISREEFVQRFYTPRLLRDARAAK